MVTNNKRCIVCGEKADPLHSDMSYGFNPKIYHYCSKECSMKHWDFLLKRQNNNKTRKPKKVSLCVLEVGLIYEDPSERADFISRIKTATAGYEVYLEEKS